MNTEVLKFGGLDFEKCKFHYSQYPNDTNQLGIH